jgi:hypothetical protein
MDIMDRSSRMTMVSQDLVHRVFTCTEKQDMMDSSTLYATLRSMVDAGQKSVWVKESLHHAAESTIVGWHRKLCNMCDATLAVLMGYEITSVNQFNTIECNLLQTVLLDNDDFLLTPTGMALKEQRSKTTTSVEQQQQQPDNGDGTKQPASSVAAAILQRQEEMKDDGLPIKKTNIIDVLTIAVQQENQDKAMMMMMLNKKIKNKSILILIFSSSPVLMVAMTTTTTRMLLIVILDHTRPTWNISKTKWNLLTWKASSWRSRRLAKRKKSSTEP